MATVTWPAALPQDFLRSDYEETLTDNIIVSNYDVGPAGLRRRVTQNAFSVRGEMFMTTEEWELLEEFIANEILERSLPFGFPAQGISTTAEWLVVMDESPARTWSAEDFWRVSISLVILP